MSSLRVLVRRRADHEADHASACTERSACLRVQICVHLLTLNAFYFPNFELVTKYSPITLFCRFFELNPLSHSSSLPSSFPCSFHRSFVRLSEPVDAVAVVAVVAAVGRSVGETRKEERVGAVLPISVSTSFGLSHAAYACTNFSLDFFFLQPTVTVCGHGTEYVIYIKNHAWYNDFKTTILFVSSSSFKRAPPRPFWHPYLVRRPGVIFKIKINLSQTITLPLISRQRSICFSPFAGAASPHNFLPSPFSYREGRERGSAA